MLDEPDDRPERPERPPTPHLTNGHPEVRTNCNASEEEKPISLSKEDQAALEAALKNFKLRALKEIRSPGRSKNNYSPSNQFLMNKKRKHSNKFLQILRAFWR